jgi:hypothetical protein
VDMVSRSRGALRPRFDLLCPPRKSEGAGKTGCLLHPRSRVRFAQTNMHTSIQGSGKHSGLPCAMALRLTSCSPRRTALLPPSPARSFASPGLSASTAAPEPHDLMSRGFFGLLKTAKRLKTKTFSDFCRTNRKAARTRRAPIGPSFAVCVAAAPAFCNPWARRGPVWPSLRVKGHGDIPRPWGMSDSAPKAAVL